jgi:large subunit ribosomal protein L29
MSSAAEIREFDETELENKLAEARKELFNLRFQSATGRLDNNSRVQQVRRDIARLLTVQRAREIELAESAEAVAAPLEAGTKEQ